MRLPLRGSKAFTLIELIVVIVILALLALIAIPTFQHVINRSQDAATLTELQATAREASALAALDGQGVAAYTTTSLLQYKNSSASGVGTFAAGSSQPQSVAYDTAHGGDSTAGTIGIVSNSRGFFSAGVSTDGSTLSLAMRSSYTGHCVFAVYENGTLTGTAIRDYVVTGSAACQASSAPNVVGGPVSNPNPSTPAPQPSTPVASPAKDPLVSPITCTSDGCGYVPPIACSDSCGQVTPGTGVGTDVSMTAAAGDLNYMGSFAYRSGDTSDSVYASLRSTGALALVTDTLDGNGTIKQVTPTDSIPAAAGVLVGNNPVKAYAGFDWVADSVYVTSQVADGKVYRVDVKSGAASVVASGLANPTHLTGWACPTGTPVPAGAKYATCLYVTTDTGVAALALGADGQATRLKDITTDARWKASSGIRLMGVNGQLRLWVAGNTDSGTPAATGVFDVNGNLLGTVGGSGAVAGLEHVGSTVYAGAIGTIQRTSDDGSGSWSTYLGDPNDTGAVLGDVADARTGYVSDVHDHGRPGRMYYVDFDHNSLNAIQGGKVTQVVGYQAGPQKQLSVARLGDGDAPTGYACATVEGGKAACQSMRLYDLQGAMYSNTWRSTSSLETAPLNGVTSVAAADTKTCAVAGGTVHCWSPMSYDSMEDFPAPAAFDKVYLPKSPMDGDRYQMAATTPSGDVYLYGEDPSFSEDGTQWWKVSGLTSPVKQVGWSFQDSEYMQPYFLQADGRVAYSEYGSPSYMKPFGGSSDVHASAIWEVSNGMVLSTSDGKVYHHHYHMGRDGLEEVTTVGLADAVNEPGTIRSTSTNIFTYVTKDGNATVVNGQWNGQDFLTYERYSRQAMFAKISQVDTTLYDDTGAFVYLTDSGEIGFMHGFEQGIN